MAEKKTFEEMIKELEETVAKLENVSGGLDDTVKLYEQGVKLAAECNKLLDAAEQKISVLTKNMEEAPFAPKE